MANGTTHQNVGMLVGGIAAAWQAREQQPLHRVIETAGGALAGRYFAGVLPDILEPATSSFHRGFGHSATAGVAVCSGAARMAGEPQAWLRARADEHAQARVAMPGDRLGQFLHWLAEVFWRLLAGAASGFAPAFASHLVLDAFTPRGVPVVARGF